MSKDNPYQGYHAQLLEKLERLEHENAALKQRILDDNKAYGCELRDPSGTIWDHAKRLQQENNLLRHALPVPDKQGVLFGATWLSYDKILGFEGDDSARDGFYKESLPAGFIAWANRVHAARKEAQP